MNMDVFDKIAIIPARGGSKGLPGKNIKQLCGRPLIHWTIKQALDSNEFDDVFVSTDDPMIMEVANKLGNFCPELRPSSLANDESKTIDVILYTIKKYYSSKKNPLVVLLEPTSPLREAEDIKNAITLFKDSGADSLVSVSKTETQNPAFLFKMDIINRLQPISGIFPNSLRRQEIEDCFFIEGCLYISWFNSLVKNEGFLGPNTIGYKVPKWKSYEIDDIFDFKCVEAVMKEFYKHEL